MTYPKKEWDTDSSDVIHEMLETWSFDEIVREMSHWTEENFMDDYVRDEIWKFSPMLFKMVYSWEYFGLDENDDEIGRDDYFRLKSKRDDKFFPLVGPYIPPEFR